MRGVFRLSRILKGPALGLGLILLLFLIWFYAHRPSNDRPWQPGLERLPTATFSGDTVSIRNVRDFRTRDDGTRSPSWDTRSFDLDQVDSLWYILSVFNGDGWRGPAHGMLSFGFADGRFLVLSVEARKEVGESYSVWKGMVRSYEMMYVMGDERDLILDRCAYRDDVVYLYPITARPDQIRRLLEDMLHSANELHEKPRFYNTLTLNCTSRLRDHVNRVFPGRVPPTWKVILPGYSDELLEELGLLADERPVEEVRRFHRIDELGTEIGDVPDFSRRLREAFQQTAVGSIPERRP